jgi:SAM-dependent methyltransferase
MAVKIILSDSQKHPGEGSFDWVPSSFRKDARMTWHQRRRHAAVKRLIRGLEGRVLDYGCGYGDIAYAVSKARQVAGVAGVADVVAVDVDPPRIAFASAEYAPIPFSVCQGDRLDFQDNSFDVVLSVVVIHFAADPLRYLRECRRVLRPGGHLALICRQHSAVRERLRAMMRGRPLTLAQWVGPDGQSRELWIPSHDEMIAVASREGFRVVREDSFYDPPTEIGTHWKAWPDRLIEQAASIFGIGATANYFCLLLQKGAS